MATQIEAQISPSLRSVLACTSGNPLQEARNIAQILYDYRAFAELDFTRKPGTSYNPRPYRIPEIIYRNGKHQSSHTLLAAMLSCLPWDVDWKKIYHLKNIDADIISLAHASHRSLSQLYSGSPVVFELSEVEQHIIVSQHIDRLRHVHQATSELSFDLMSVSHQVLTIIPDGQNNYGEIINLCLNRLSIKHEQ